MKGCKKPKFGRRSSAITSRMFLAPAGAGGVGGCSSAALTAVPEALRPASLFLRWQQPNGSVGVHFVAGLNVKKRHSPVAAWLATHRLQHSPALDATTPTPTSLPSKLVWFCNAPQVASAAAAAAVTGHTQANAAAARQAYTTREIFVFTKMSWKGNAVATPPAQAPVQPLQALHTRNLML